MAKLKKLAKQTLMKQEKQAQVEMEKDVAATEADAKKAKEHDVQTIKTADAEAVKQTGPAKSEETRKEAAAHEEVLAELANEKKVKLEALKMRKRQKRRQ